MTDADLVGEYQEPDVWWQVVSQTAQLERVKWYQPPQQIKSYPARTATLSQIIGTNWLAVGDAAISYDPLASYGITATLGSGYYAGRAIIDHLHGETEAIPTYEAIQQQTFAQ